MMRATRYRLQPLFIILSGLWGLFLALRTPYLSSIFFAELFVVLSVIGLPVFFGLYMFAFEGNYMDGLWTRPIEIKKIMQVKYVGYTIDAVLMTILCYVFYCFFHGEIELSPWFFFSTFMSSTSTFAVMVSPMKTGAAKKRSSFT